MAKRRTTLERAQELVGTPLEGYFLGSRIHPLASALPTAVFAMALLSGSLYVLVPATGILLVGLYLLLGRAVAVTADELVVIQNRPPLWRPARIRARYGRDEVSITKKRRLWRVTIGPETYFVNRAFEAQIALLGGVGARPPDEPQPPTTSRPVAESRRVTPKGTPPRRRRR